MNSIQKEGLIAKDPRAGSFARSTYEDAASQGRSLARSALVGGFLGPAWGASLRAWMALLALEMGDSPRLTWAGTFGAVLLPTTLVGALLGAAAHEAETSDRKRWRWAVLSPLLLVVGPVIVTEDFFSTLITTGIGGGAIGVALIGALGGYATSGFGARWTRWVSGTLAVCLTIATVYPIYFSNREPASTPDANKVFGSLLFVMLMVLFVAGVGAPAQRKRIRGRTPRSTF
jgi:hypothetical protein